MWINILFWALIIIYLADNIISCKIISYVGKTTKEVGKDLDNTEEITKKVKELLLGKSVLHRRLINAYPKIQSIKVRIKEKKEKLKKQVEKQKEEIKDKMDNIKEDKR